MLHFLALKMKEKKNSISFNTQFSVCEWGHHEMKEGGKCEKDKRESEEDP